MPQQTGDQDGGEEGPKKDEHGCIIGKERWDPELEKCVPIEKPAEKVAQEAIRENEQLRAKIRALQTEKGELAKQLATANDILEAQVRGNLEREIKQVSHLTDVKLASMSLDDLQRTRDTLLVAKHPRKSIRPGPMGPALDEDEGLTVGDISVVTAERRKRLMEA